MRKTLTARQYEILVEYLSRHRDLALDGFKVRDAKIVSKRLWEKIAGLLNAEVGGLNKDGAQWSKWYTDHKTNLIKKYWNNQTGTGGGPGENIAPLTDSERRLCAVLGLGEEVSCGGFTISNTQLFPEWYTDHKTNLIKKYWDNQTGTGGGPGENIAPLTDSERRLCAVLGLGEEVSCGGFTISNTQLFPEIPTEPPTTEPRTEPPTTEEYSKYE